MAKSTERVCRNAERRVKNGETVNARRVFERKRRQRAKATKCDEVHFGHCREPLWIDVDATLVDAQMTQILNIPKSFQLCVISFMKEYSYLNECLK